MWVYFVRFFPILFANWCPFNLQNLLDKEKGFLLKNLFEFSVEYIISQPQCSLSTNNQTSEKKFDGHATSSDESQSSGEESEENSEEEDSVNGDNLQNIFNLIKLLTLIQLSTKYQSKGGANGPWPGPWLENSGFGKNLC